MEQSFLDAIARAPTDDAPRLVYADWLLDRGDLRGELIQLQITRPDDSRVKELLAEHQEEWFGLPWDERVRFVFDRGFPTGRFGHAGLWVERKDTEENSYGCHRYFPDGTMSTVSIGADCSDPEVLRQVVRWFGHGYETGGPYTLKFGAGATPVLEATSTSRIGRVDYSGRLEGATLSYRWFSHINGNSGETSLSLVEVEGCDSRP